MAIEFNCPHCATPYRLKDELAGKKAACKNPDCRQVLTIPAAKATVPPTAAPPPAAKPPAPKPAPPKPAARKDATPAPKPPPPKPEDLEAAALAALADAPAEEAAKDTPIPVACAFCDHKWTEPRDKAGKNVLCPNPECRQRNKVPVPKDDKPKDWRATAQGPSLAKENFEKPKDVMDAEARVVSKQAWTEGGGADQDLEPVPLKRRLFFALLVLTPIVGLGYGIYWLVTTRTEVNRDELVLKALKEMEPAAKELPGAEGPLFSALLHTAAGEYELRETDKPDEALKKALEHFTKARDELRQAAAKDDPKKGGGAARFCAGGELALAQLGLGGTDEQVKEGTRYRWVPKTGAGPRQRVNEKVVDVHTELQRTLQLVLPADFDTRIALARRLTRELLKKGQADLAADLPVMLFAAAEQAEAKAVVALEVWRADKAHPFPKAAADDLKTTLAKGGDRSATSAVVLWKAVGTDKAPNLIDLRLPGANAKVIDNTRLAVVGLALLDGKADEAQEVARRPGSVPSQLKAAILIAEWSPDPGQAFDVALAQLAGVTGKKTPEPSSLPPPGVLLRLAQLAGAAGKLEPAKQFADAIPDDGLKAWAKADALRLAAPPGARLDEAAFEAPDDATKLRAGHGWGRYWVARHNTRLSGDRGKETAAVKDWPRGTVQPLGWAGVAVGLRER